MESRTRVSKFMVSKGLTVTETDRVLFQINSYTSSIIIRYATSEALNDCHATGNVNVGLQWACQFNNNTKLVKSLLELGGNIHVNDNLNHIIQICNVELLKYLVVNNIVKIQNIDTNLIYNCIYDPSEMVKYLIEAGMVIDPKIGAWSKEIDNFELTKYLFCKGAFFK